MATFITLTDKVTEVSIAAIKAPQCREILSFLFKEYGVGNPINNGDLLLEMNTHQHDGKVLSKGSAGPISRIYEFYRKRGLEDPGFITVTKSPTKKENAEQLQAKLARALEIIRLLSGNDDISEYEEEING